MPNLILMMVEREGERVVVGGYSSCGWARIPSLSQMDEEMYNNLSLGGDSSCFVFNVTSNLRFEPVKGMEDQKQTQLYTQLLWAVDDDSDESVDN